MMSVLLVATLLAAPAKAVAPPPSAAVKPVNAVSKAADAGAASLEQAGEVKEIELDEKRARAVYKIHTAISIPAVVEFPESFVAPPACGDCAVSLKPGEQSSALFALTAEPNGNILIVKPRLYPGPQGDGSVIMANEFVTTITVRLQSLTLTLQVELTENKSLADARVKFVLPNRGAETKYVADAIAKAKAQFEADFAGRVEQAGAEALLRSFLEPHECRVNTTRARDSDMVVELRELCRFGKRIYVRFSVENRGRSLFVVGDAAGGIGDGKGFASAETQQLLSLTEVAFQQSAEGVVSFEVDDASARSFELRLTEKGGRNRTVAVTGFSF